MFALCIRNLPSPLSAASTMADLPPKIPNLAPNPSPAPNPSWVDEFLHFSSARRGSHRRSISDSIAFLEPPAPLDHPDLDKFHDYHFFSMFNDHLPPSLSNSSTPSDHNSISKQKQHLHTDAARNEFDEVQSQCCTHAQHPCSDRIVDPKRVKRLLANRQSAQKSRVRKLQYISELERSVTSLQAEVSVLSPRVAFLDHQRLLLNVDNSALKQRIAALAQDKIFKDAHQEALKREIARLRQVYEEQKMAGEHEKEPQLLNV